MSKPHEIVKTGMALSEFFRRFPDDQTAEAWFVSRRWPDGPICVHCDSMRVSAVASRRPQPYRCKDCRRHFSVKSYSVMHDSKLGCQTWLLAVFLVVSNPKGRSSVQLAADLGICQKSAWHLAHRIRKALVDGGMFGFEGPVEVDETFIGGKAKNMHAKVRRERVHGRGAVGKAPVVGVKDRASGKVNARVTPHVLSDVLVGAVTDTTRPGAAVFTDSNSGYASLSAFGYRHEKVMHSLGEYVRGEVSTNGIENFWSGLKRTYIGTYHYMSPEHLHRYVTEHSFRYNRRSRHVIDRMSEAAVQMDGRSLTWRELTGSRS